MMTRYAVWLDKKGLDAIDPSIFILDIAYGAPVFSNNTTDIPGRNGQRMSGRYVRSMSVTVTVEIHEYDVARRQDVCQKIQRWAMNGKVLTTNDRKGQRLRVICENPVEITSALKWTQPLKMIFTAYEQPFWEDEHPRSVTLDSVNMSKPLYTPGIGAQTRVEVTVKNVSGDAIETLTLKAGSTQMRFEGLALAANDALEIGYDENDLLFIRTGEGSKMRCRTATSDDDLMVETGKSETMSAECDAAVSVTFRTRGLYM